MNQNIAQYQSIDENISVNTTKHDSIYTSKFFSNNNENKKEESTNIESERHSNFLKALNLMKSLNEEELFNSVDEYSEISPNLTKQENISNYIHKPLTKEIIKNGNNLIVQKPIYKFGMAINNPFNFNSNILNILINKNKNTAKKMDKICHEISNKNIYFNNNFDKFINKNNKNPLFKSLINSNDFLSNNEAIENKENSSLFCKKNIYDSINNKKRITEFISPEIENLIKDIETPVDIKIDSCQKQINIIKKNLRFCYKKHENYNNNISYSRQKNINEFTTAKEEFYYNVEDNKENNSDNISSISKEPVVENLMNKFDLCSKDSSTIRNRSDLKTIKNKEEIKVFELSNDLNINRNKENIN